VSILQRATGASRKEVQEILKQAGNKVPVALVMFEANVTRADAERALKSTGGNVRRAIAQAKHA
jgi:N-acetylmuramic acid 6-phosphate (MurNAc-6-P) etherase